MSRLDITYAMDSLGISDPRRVPALPLRPARLAEGAVNREASIHKATQGVMDTWNAWVDCVERAFQHMGDQTEELEVSEDEYISFVQMFASHPARPTQRPFEDMTEHEIWFIQAKPHTYLTYLHDLWNSYADKLEKTYVGMAAKLGRCNVLAAPIELTSTRGRLHGILRSMLGPERLFHGLVDTGTDEMVAVAEMSLQGLSISSAEQPMSGKETVDLHGEPATHMEDAKNLIVGLENLNIGAASPE